VDGGDNLNDHVEIDFSASTPSQVNSHQLAATEPQTENGKKQGTKPQSKVSPFTNMHHKLNFIPHSEYLIANFSLSSFLLISCLM
jgi:hypothetical protein